LAGLRVCFLAGTLGQGGAERQLFYIASILQRSAAEVLVLSLTAGELWESRLRAVGIPVRFVGSSRLRLKRLLEITRTVRKFRPDIVQSQHFYTNGYSALAARLAGSRSVGGVRNDGCSELRDCGSVWGRVCLRLPVVLAANSRAAMRNLQCLGCPPAQLHYLPNVIDTHRFAPPGNRHGSVPLILGIGRLVPQKRFDRFLRVLALVQRSSHVPFQALIAGDGPLRAALEQQAREAGLFPGKLEFLGNVPEIESLYRKAHLLLLTSDHEGTPNVVLEAMASGLPVVATAVGGVPDLVQNGATGFVADAADEPRLTEALIQLLHDDALRLRMSHRARGFVEARHSLASLPAALQNLYGRVLQTEKRLPAPQEAKAV
jgi:glycosyltransferase involved in cell wall biosynthesis